MAQKKYTCELSRQEIKTIQAALHLVTQTQDVVGCDVKLRGRVIRVSDKLYEIVNPATVEEV